MCLTIDSSSSRDSEAALASSCLSIWAGSRISQLRLDRARSPRWALLVSAGGFEHPHLFLPWMAGNNLSPNNALQNKSERISLQRGSPALRAINQIGNYNYCPIGKPSIYCSPALGKGKKTKTSRAMFCGANAIFFFKITKPFQMALIFMAALAVHGIL